MDFLFLYLNCLLHFLDMLNQLSLFAFACVAQLICILELKTKLEEMHSQT